MSRYVTTIYIVALSPGHSDISRFRPWSQIAKGNYLHGDEKFPKIDQTTESFDDLTRVQAFWDPFS